MSLFRWFSKKVSAPPSLLKVQASVILTRRSPIHPAEGRALKVRNRFPVVRPIARVSDLERRELLYAVVRESMTRAGLLSSSYKFKVLSLDSRGRQYLIMMDMARPNISDAQRLSDIEIHIAKVAKSRHDILVTAVYWRVNEHVTAGLARSVPSVAAPAQQWQIHPQYCLDPDRIESL